MMTFYLGISEDKFCQNKMFLKYPIWPGILLDQVIFLLLNSWLLFESGKENNSYPLISNQSSNLITNPNPGDANS